MRFLPLLLTCAAMPLAAFAQDIQPQGDLPAALIWPELPVAAAPSTEAQPEASPAAAPEPAVAAAPAAAEGDYVQAFGPPAIWGGAGLEQCMVRPWIDAFGDCLASLGAGEEAVRFADALKADPAIGMAGVMRAFFELGEVDVALVDFPARANANTQVVFLNGATPLLLAEGLEAAPPETRAVAELRAAHPAAMAAGPREYLSHREYLDGLQRIVLRDRITDGCRACPILATEVVFVDFKGGALSDVSVGAWLPADLDPQALGAGIDAGDLTALQSQLIMRGYDVGGADGISGPMTLAAQGDFLTEHCLQGEADAPLSAVARAVLVDGALGRCPSH